MTSRIDLCGEGAACFLPAGAAGKWQSSSEETAPLQSILTWREAKEKPPVPPTSSEHVGIAMRTISAPCSIPR